MATWSYRTVVRVTTHTSKQKGQIVSAADKNSMEQTSFHQHCDQQDCWQLQATDILKQVSEEWHTCLHFITFHSIPFLWVRRALLRLCSVRFRKSDWMNQKESEIVKSLHKNAILISHNSAFNVIVTNLKTK